MPSKVAYTWIARISAFIWGFAFIHLFKYILDNIYPFWSGAVSLSFFAYLMIFIVWVSYSLFFYFHPYRNKLPGILYHTIFTINALIFFFGIVNIGEKNYLNLYPLLFTFQLLIYFFFISSIFPSLLPFRISVLAGILPGLITYPYIGNIYIDIFLPAVVYLMPIGIFSISKVTFSNSQQRMLPLRQSIDMLRYLFMGLSFYGIFDVYRERFYITVFILATGPVLSYFFFLTDKKKHHIKYGIFLLAIAFIFSAGIYSQLAMTYWSAISFCVLTVWEGIYFKKVVEGDLKREQILSGIALVLVILLYMISPEWIAIISGLIVFIIQSYILNYIAKGYRKTISLLFAISLLTWAIVIFTSYLSSYKRDFLAHQKTLDINPPPSLKVLNLIKDKNTILATNLFPESAAESFSKETGVQILSVDVHSSTFLSTIQNIAIHHPGAIQLYTLENLNPYNKLNGEKYIFKFTNSHKINSVYIYDYNFPDKYHDAANVFSLNDTPNIDPLSIELWFSFTSKLSNWYLLNKYDEFALKVMKEISAWYDTPALNRQIAHIYGILGETQNELNHLQKIYEKGQSNTEDKNLLLELNFLTGNTSRAEQLCDELILLDSENIIAYQEWKYKIIKRQSNRFKLESLANTLRYMGDNLPPDKISQKNDLLRRIQQDIQSTPQWEEIYKKEKNRQENIAYPE
ncbi:MAG: hypothetical protein OEV78_09395 [Spirochaetia bacterium]|nr:hypothetical protein [Spirochaetia bacterium]